MAMEVLDSMWLSKIMPRAEHYACIVDMLGRAGFLNDAKTFIEKLIFKPKMLLWQTLLGTWKIHGNTEIGMQLTSCSVRHPTLHQLMYCWAIFTRRRNVGGDG
jgi:hypothetical protein